MLLAYKIYYIFMHYNELIVFIFFLLHSLCISDITVHPPEQISLSKICVCALRIFKTHKNDGNRFPSDFIRRDLPRKGDLVKVACFSYFSKTLRHQKPYCGFDEKNPKQTSKLVYHMWQSNWDSQIDTPGYFQMCETSGWHTENLLINFASFELKLMRAWDDSETLYLNQTDITHS